MKVITAMIAGAIACLVGAGIWTAVTYFTHYEIGWVAWGIGALVGVAVFLGAAKQGDPSMGILAVLFALAGILAGKYGVAYVSVHGFTSGDDMYIGALAGEVMHKREKQGEFFPPPSMQQMDEAETFEELFPKHIWAEAKQTWDSMPEAQRDELRASPSFAYDDYHITYMAGQLVEEYARENKTLNWPADSGPMMAFYEEEFPTDLWADAKQRWESMSAEEQRSYRDSIVASEKVLTDTMMPAMQEEGIAEMFKSSFSPYDGLWALLAVLSAFKIASASEPKAA